MFSKNIEILGGTTLSKIKEKNDPEREGIENRLVEMKKKGQKTAVMFGEKKTTEIQKKAGKSKLPKKVEM
jgi:hypothetical protein